MIKFIKKSARILAESSNGNPLSSTATVILFYFMFNFFEGLIEILLFGSRFEHGLDVFFAACFIAYAGFVVCACADYNSAINPKYGCHLEAPNILPDCVMDYGDYGGCTYAKKGMKREECEYWRLVK